MQKCWTIYYNSVQMSSGELLLTSSSFKLCMKNSSMLYKHITWKGQEKAKQLVLSVTRSASSSAGKGCELEHAVGQVFQHSSMEDVLHVWPCPLADFSLSSSIINWFSQYTAVCCRMLILSIYKYLVYKEAHGIESFQIWILLFQVWVLLSASGPVGLSEWGLSLLLYTTPYWNW